MKPTRYRIEALPIEGATAREWNPPQLQLADPAQQGILPFSDGSQLGPLFNTNNNHGGGSSASNSSSDADLLARWEAAKKAVRAARQEEVSARDALVLGLALWTELGLVAQLGWQGGYRITEGKP